MLDFDTEPARPYTRPSERSRLGALWVTLASAVFIGAFLAGAALLVCVRFYVKESISDTFKKKPAAPVDTPHK